MKVKKVVLRKRAEGPAVLACIFDQNRRRNDSLLTDRAVAPPASRVQASTSSLASPPVLASHTSLACLAKPTAPASLCASLWPPSRLCIFSIQLNSSSLTRQAVARGVDLTVGPLKATHLGKHAFQMTHCHSPAAVAQLWPAYPHPAHLRSTFPMLAHLSTLIGLRQTPPPSQPHH